jgi:chitinase
MSLRRASLLLSVTFLACTTGTIDGPSTSQPVETFDGGARGNRDTGVSSRDGGTTTTPTGDTGTTTPTSDSGVPPTPPEDTGTTPTTDSAAPPVDSGTTPTTDTGPVDPGPPPTGEKLFVGYFETWSDRYVRTGEETTLAKLPAYVNVVNLSFALPDTKYTPGSLVLTGARLDVSYDGPTLKAAVVALKKKHPSTKVMLSVGGATYTNWAGFQPEAIAALVNDFGLDGVDLDYEPASPSCTASGGKVNCPSDAEYISLVKRMRAVMPRPKWLSIAAWSVGAYGEGEWATALPGGSAYTGIALGLLKDSTAAAALDLVNVMSYDAGTSYDPKVALNAYRHYFKGRIAMGVEAAPEAWGGHVYTAAEVEGLADAVNTAGTSGLMLWSIHKAGAQPLATAACNKLRLGECATAMLSP